MRKIVIRCMFAAGGMAILFLLSKFLVELLNSNEHARVSPIKRIAVCQFGKIYIALQNDVVFLESKFDGNSNWFANLDLDEVSCGRELTVTGDRLFDFSGAEIVVDVDENYKPEYLKRVKGKSGRFILLKRNKHKFLSAIDGEI